MNRIAITVNGRTVFWEIPTEHAAIAMQSFVQTLGPGREASE